MLELLNGWGKNITKSLSSALIWYRMQAMDDSMNTKKNKFYYPIQIIHSKDGKFLLQWFR
jgi:hypothetical protein